jgi:hypothetical protein
VANYDAFYDYVLVDVPGSPPAALATQAIRNAVIDFCRITRLYTYQIPNITVTAGTSSYTLAPESNTKTAEVEHVEFDKNPLYPASEQLLDSLYDNWRDTGVQDTPCYYLLNRDRTSITLVKTPAVGGTLAVKIAQKPSRASTTCPDWVLEEHAETIACGAKAKLFAMKAKPWSDAGLATYHKEMFDSACGVASIAADRSNTRTPLRSTPVYR